MLDNITYDVTISHMSKRIVFTFSEKAAKQLTSLTKRKRFSSLASTVRSSLQLADAIQKQAAEGFSEIIVRNPCSKDERVLIITD